MMQNGLKILLSVVLALFPALSIYILLPGMSVASFFIWMCFIPLLVFNNKDGFNKDETIFLFVIILISVLSALLHLVLNSEWFDFILFYHNLFAIVVHLIPLCFITKWVDEKIFLKSILVFSTIASLVLIWQWLSFLLTGTFQKGFFLPGLVVNSNVTLLSTTRPSAFFTEPAHFCIYLLPAFQIALYREYRILIYLFAFAIFCSGSTTGFLLVIVLFIYHLFFVCKKKIDTIALKIVAAMLCLMIILFFVPNFFDGNLIKLGEIEQGNSASRLLGPLGYLSFFQFYEHVVGITLNQVENLLSMNHFVVNGSGNYANACLYMYISYGLVGLIALVLYVKRKFKSVQQTKGFFLIFLGIICSDQILFNGNYVYLVSFFLIAEKCNENSHQGNYKPFL
jgi:hypothetical protein